MAVVKMGQIKSTVSKAIAYITRADATGDGLWVSTNAAVIEPSDHAAIGRAFEATTRQVGVQKNRAGSVLAHHIIQSFSPTDGVDAETAHALGVQLAERVTGGAHEYVIATHFDKGHTHNHIIFNATSFETGRKFRCVRSTIGNVRAINDELCEKAGLSVLPDPKRSTGQSFAEIYRALKGVSALEVLRTSIDRAAERATSWDDFERLLTRRGIEVTVREGRNGSVTYREMTMGRAVRDYRLGETYTERSVMARLSRSAVNELGVDQSMIVKETKDALTVVVPGSNRELFLTVSKQQIVRHGRAVRIYVPARESQRLTNRGGDLAKTVSAVGLYRWFAEPDLAATARGAKTKQLDAGLVGAWSSQLSELRELTDRINAKARWSANDGGLMGALTSAREALQERQSEFQLTLVAMTEVLNDPAARPSEVRVMQAQIRILEREIATFRGDVAALTRLTKEEMKMEVSARIGAVTDDARRTQRDAVVAGTRESRRDSDGDRATTNDIAERLDAERDTDALVEDDARDRDGGTGSMSIQERIQQQVERMKEQAEGNTPAVEERGRGWTL